MAAWLNIAYLVSAVMFVLGIRMLSSITNSRHGNQIASIGMLIAVVVTLLYYNIVHWQWVLVSLFVGTSIGLMLAMKVKIVAMPQLVALFNGFGGLASAFVGSIVSYQIIFQNESMTPAQLIAVIASLMIGAVTFSGSMIAFSKLQFAKARSSFCFYGQKTLNVVLIFVILGLCAGLYIQFDAELYFALTGLALLLGIVLLLPIGGADMPVVIALLNSYSGLAACAVGFAISNHMLIIAGALVGTSGFILTRVMCKAMNRSIWHVMFANVEALADQKSADEFYTQIKSIDAEEAALILGQARNVAIVPGYGIAVAQGQFAVSDLAKYLKSKGKKVYYGIHPVAGRMPGHMNVLLAEANVPYEDLYDIDQMNHEFVSMDAVLVVGANDTVNPQARESASGPLAGMPILNVDEAKSVIVIKRSLSPGFSGIPNSLFNMDHVMMLFGDGKQMVQEITRQLTNE